MAEIAREPFPDEVRPATDWTTGTVPALDNTCVGDYLVFVEYKGARRIQEGDKGYHAVATSDALSGGDVGIMTHRRNQWWIDAVGQAP